MSTSVISSPSVSAPAISLLVLGSINADVYIEVDRLPVAGETIAALPTSGIVRAGGKGANTAVSVAKLLGHPQSRSQFICCYGHDAHPSMLRAVMKQNHVDDSLALNSTDSPSGAAYIFIQPGGVNSIIIVSAANHAWPHQLSEDIEHSIKQAQMILLQREIPERVNLLVSQIGSVYGVPVFLDMGGEHHLPDPSLLKGLFCFAPNETELARLVSMPTDTEQQVINAAYQAQQQYEIQYLLVTLGSRGVFLFLPTSFPIAETETETDSANHRDRFIYQSAYPVTVVDTTGAGDTFRGAFCVSYCELNPAERLSLRCLSACLSFASAAAALCCQQAGTISAVPNRNQVLAFMKTHSDAAHTKQGEQQGAPSH